jgi:uncharacterized membrane protein YdjX (TVP38/TMEM64 family)
MKQLILTSVGLLVLLAVPFVLWGDAEWLSPDFARAHLSANQDRIIPIALMIFVLDIALPVPASVVMTLLAGVLGFWMGLAVTLVGTTTSALVAYVLARIAGRPGIQLVISPENLARIEDQFEQKGMLFVCASRGLPILPEAASLLAGLGKMSFGRFLLASVAGTLPVAVLFCGLGLWWGGADAEEGTWVMAISAGLPILLAGVVQSVDRWNSRKISS